MSRPDDIVSGRELKVYLALGDRAVDPLAAGLREELASEFEMLAVRTNGRILEALRRAYMSGVRDGFVQGVQAQAEAEADPR
jgi:hypothetical protein